MATLGSDVNHMKLLETWVKAPSLMGASLLIVGECVQTVYPILYGEFAEGREVLTSCPEAENSESAAAKLASIIKCSSPKEVVVLTIDGSPHCFALHAALNNAVFVASSDIACKHFVIVNGEAMEVRPQSIRVARYLHIVEKCVREHPEILKDLNLYSLEHPDNQE